VIEAAFDASYQAVNAKLAGVHAADGVADFSSERVSPIALTAATW
jgi:hypothetical protein